MQFARPPEGFRIVVLKRVQDYVEAEAAGNPLYPRLLQQWEDLKARLSIVALREGVHLSGEPHNRFSHVADGSVSYSVPTIQTLYSILSDTLTIYAALIWRDQDFDDDDASS